MTRTTDGSRAVGRIAALLATATVLALVGAGSAQAAGGIPSQAFTLGPGAVGTGDTSRQIDDTGRTRREFWAIQLRANDYVTFQWSQPAGGNVDLFLLAPGVNDSNFTQMERNPVFRRDTDSTGRDEVKVTIGSTGTYYLLFRSSYRHNAYEVKYTIRRGLKKGDAPSVGFAVKAGRQHGGDVTRHIADTQGAFREYWRLPLRARDRVTVTWSQPISGDVRLYVLPPGTNNANALSVQRLVESSTDSAGRGTLTFDAPRKGAYILDFKGYRGGAYKFRVTVKHR